MSTKSEEERERLKEEYKEHYRSIKEAKVRLKAAGQRAKISAALQNMNADGLMESVDGLLDKIKDKVTLVEARLEVALDSMEEEDSDFSRTEKHQEADELMQRQRAKETLKQVKAEMGMLYSEIEKQAEELKAEKTIGNKTEEKTVRDTGKEPD